MIRTFLIAAAALAGSSGLALAQGGMSANPPTETTICLDVGGQSLPATCKVPGSRLDKREDICICRQGMRVDAPVCAPGQKAPTENLAFEKARKLAARDGSIIGDLYEGQPMCVEPRKP